MRQDQTENSPGHRVDQVRVRVVRAPRNVGHQVDFAHDRGSRVCEGCGVGGEDGKYGSLQMPGNTGGGNWEGGTFDPETGMLYIFSSTAYARRSLVHDPRRGS